MDENAPPPLNAPPPVSPPPPVITPPAASPASRRGRGWMVMAFVLLGLLALSVVYIIGGAARGLFPGGTAGLHYRMGGPRLDEVVREDHGSGNKIAVVPVEGLISGSALSSDGFSLVDVIRAQLERAEEDDRVKAVILKVDSPGGEVLAADEIYRIIAKFQDQTQKPVVASMGSLAASGGYYVSAPCRWITANDLTITGSIGVILSAWNYRGLMDKVGVRPQTFKSGKYKDMLSGTRDPDAMTAEERAMVQGLIDETFAKFKQVVQDGRDRARRANKNAPDKGRALADDWEEYADGRILSGTEAYQIGFVDELGGFDTAVARTKKLAGITNANLIEYRQRYDLADLFQLFGKSDARALKVDFGFEPPKLEAGRLYFLAPNFVH